MTLELEKVTGNKIGSSVNLVKTKFKEGKTSNVKVGSKITGTLAKTIKSGKKIYVKTKGENSRPASSKVVNITFPENKMVVETETSFYEQVL